MNLRVKAVRSELAKELMIRKRKSHKIDNRTVLIVGENRELVGAPALADLASLRAGADLTFNTISNHSKYFVKQTQLLKILRISRRKGRCRNNYEQTSRMKKAIEKEES